MKYVHHCEAERRANGRLWNGNTRCPASKRSSNFNSIVKNYASLLLDAKMSVIKHY
jgi:hypothetical protein